MSDILEELSDIGIADNETYRTCLKAKVEIEELRRQRDAYANEITGALLPANERLRKEIERLHSEYAELDGLRHAACDQRDEYKADLKRWMLDVPDDKDAEIERLHRLLQEALNGPGWQDEHWRDAAREALDNE